MLKAQKERIFLTRFLEQLEIVPAEIQWDPAGVLWLDARRRLNLCRVQDFQAASEAPSPRVRVTINKSFTPGLSRALQSVWPEMSPLRPDWNLELTCLDHELVPFAGWLASLVNRREGLIARLPAAPVALLNWSDMRRLDDYACYLSAISLRSEAAFSDDIHHAHPRRPYTPIHLAPALG